MKFCKLLKYDLKNGILKKWYLYIGTILVACIFIGDFYRRYLSSREYLEEKLTCANILFYLFQGKEPFSPDWGSPFVFPIVWVLIFIIILFGTIDYPMKSLSGHGIQVISRIGKRSYWWESKCIWITISTLLYFGIWYMTVIVYGRVVGMDISLNYSQEINSELWEMELETLTHSQEIMLLIIMPVVTALSLNFIQLCLSLFIDKVYSFMFVTFLLFASTYFKIPVAIGNFAMVKRSVYCIDEGMNVYRGLALNCIIIISCIIVGFLRIRKYDILKRDNAY